MENAKLMEKLNKRVKSWMTYGRASGSVRGKEANMTLRQDRSQPPVAPKGSPTRGAERDRFGTLSVVVPAKNESDSLPGLLGEIAASLRPLREHAENGLLGYEVVIVDDGSTDETQTVLKSLQDRHPELNIVRLEGNVGQSAATAAGFHAAKGDWIAILDADLQNDPADLAKLWGALPGHDAVLGWRVKRQDVWSKRIISRWANRIRNAVLGQEIKDTGCSVRIFPRDVALRLPLFQGAHRFFGPLLLREGCKIAQVPVNHRPRPHGKSHYNIWNRSIKVAVDLLGVAWLLRRPLRYRVLSDRLVETPHAALKRTNRDAATEKGANI
jgi:dolichol-phosphate mannosyltransferase